MDELLAIVSVDYPPDGSLRLRNRMTLNALNENSERVSAAVDEIQVNPYSTGEHWVLDKNNQIPTNCKVLILGGTLKRTEEGVVRIEGLAEDPVIVDLEQQEEALSEMIVEFSGTLSGDVFPEEKTASEKPTPQEEPVAEEVTVMAQEDGCLYLSNSITFHATDTERGWHIREQVEKIILKNYPEAEAWAATAENKIRDDQILTIRGGVCTWDSDRTALVITGDQDTPIVADLHPADKEHETHEGVCVEYLGTLGPVAKPEQDPTMFSMPVLLGTAVAAAVLGAGITALLKRSKKKKKPADEPSAPTFSPQVRALTLDYGMLQQIGKRSSQQDSYGVYGVQGGLFAVVADGMGGLKNGDAVSKRIVQTIDEDCKRLSASQLRGNLMAMAAHANDEVNRMLGPNELYKSGSTLVAVLAEPEQFSWVSIGDSRIYLFRAGRLLQLNREHNFEADLLLRAVNHQLSFQEARSNPKRRSVSSFIGMGNLKYVDEMQRPVRALKGDRVIVSSDGVFNTLQEQRIEAILTEFSSVKLAAKKLEEAILNANNPHQDNFTAVIISYD